METMNISLHFSKHSFFYVHTWFLQNERFCNEKSCKSHFLEDWPELIRCYQLFRTFFDDFLQVFGELHLSNNCCRANISTLMSTRCTMVIWVVEFSREGYKIGKFFSQKSIYSKKMIVYCELTASSCQKLPKSDFQSQFSMSFQNVSDFFSFKNIYFKRFIFQNYV